MLLYTCLGVLFEKIWFTEKRFKEEMNYTKSILTIITTSIDEDGIKTLRSQLFQFFTTYRSHKFRDPNNPLNISLLRHMLCLQSQACKNICCTGIRRCRHTSHLDFWDIHSQHDFDN